MEASARTTVIMDNQMCVQVQGEAITPEEYHNEAGWTLAGGAYVEAAPAGARQRRARRTRRESSKRKSKIQQKPILAAAKITSEESAADTICPNTQQNIMVVSTPNEDNAARYAKIQEISIQGKPYEVSAYRTAPHATVKRVIRGIPADANAEELGRNIVNERNPLAVGAKRIGSTTTAIVVFQGPKVPNFVRYGVTLIPCRLYRKQIDVCQQYGRVGHRKDVCPTPHNQDMPGLRACGPQRGPP
ncbi:hypothetical protein MTO96_025592 [Rhipicephalus appendiculatus]